MERRRFLELIAGASAAGCVPAWAQKHKKKPTPQAVEYAVPDLHPATPMAPDVTPGLPAPYTLTPADISFLDDLERRACRYFWEQASPVNGQVLDRAAANNTTGKRDPRPMSSISATGFGLTAFCIADRRGYIPHAQLVERVRRTLAFFVHKMENVHGFFSHFNDVDTGYPYRGSEISPIDTTMLLTGALTARQHFSQYHDIVALATALYEQVDWPWMLNGGTTFAMGWRAGAFIPSRWNHYCELMMMVLLALASPTHPIPAECWDAWTRPLMKFEDYTYISAADPLFVHEYSHAWFDFRGKRDAYANYFDNSIVATQAHKAWCISLGAPYSQDYWGVSASDTPHGYAAWGGPPGEGHVDGSVVPYATAGALIFDPASCLRVQHSLYQLYGDKAWGRYGFCDAMHPQVGWYDPDVLGIDLGISVLMAENLRSGLIWETFGRNPEVAVALQRAGFHSAA